MKEKTETQSLVVNFMWLKKEPSNSKFIDGSDDFSATLEKLSNWSDNLKAKAELEIEINFWHDSSLSSEKSISDSNAELMLRQKNGDILETKIRDLNEIQIFNKYHSLLNEDSSVYFRADIARVMIACHLSRENPNRIFAYFDMNIEPVNTNILLSTDTEKDLQSKGIVLCKNNQPLQKTMGYGHEPYENSFFMLNLKNDKVIKAHFEILIDIPMRFIHSLDKQERISSNIDQYIYGSYNKMLTYLSFLNGEIDFVLLEYKGLELKKEKTISINDYNSIEQVNAKRFFCLGAERVSFNPRCKIAFSGKFKDLDKYIAKEPNMSAYRHYRSIAAIKDVGKLPSKQYSRKR